MSVRNTGVERQKIALIDGCLVDPDAVVAIASRHAYAPIGPFYPGVRAAVSAQVAMPLIRPLLAELEDLFAVARPLRYLECFLSLVTASPGSLSPIQRLPHFDGVEPERIAVLVYLDRHERGGTSFFRQRSTGFESVTADRYEAYRAALTRETQQHGMPAAQFIGDNSPLFERIETIEGCYNRMAIYRGNTLHCAALGAGFVPDADPARGRLTLNLFLTAAP